MTDEPRTVPLFSPIPRNIAGPKAEDCSSQTARLGPGGVWAHVHMCTLLEMQILRPHPALLTQTSSFNKALGHLFGH